MRDFLKFSLRYGKIYDKIKTTEENVAERVGYPTLSCLSVAFKAKMSRVTGNKTMFLSII